MWNANSDDGQPVEVKLPKSVKIEAEIDQDYLGEVIYDEMSDKQDEVLSVMESRNIDMDAHTLTLQCNVDTKTGKVTVVGVGGHPIDFTKTLG